MTPEQPPISLRHPRPGAAGRRRALGLDGPSVRESLRDSLARIPDLADSDANPIIKAALAADPALRTDADPVTEAPSTLPAEPSLRTPDPVVDSPEPAFEPVPAPMPVPVSARHRRTTKAPTWRRVSFAIVLMGLIASIPALGFAGFRVISDSTDGNVNKNSLTADEPGYEAQVDPTPTAVAIQYDDEGIPTAVTFLTLSGNGKGGAVIFVPLDTEVSEPSFGVDKLRTAYKVVADRPALARERLASQVGRLLNVGIGEIIDLDNQAWTQQVAAVSPLEIENPEAVDLGGGVIIPAGPASLTAEQVGPFLAAINPGESDLNRLNRSQLVWEAWLTQVEETGTAGELPGESTAGMARFAREFAKGAVSYDTLPVSLIPAMSVTFRIDKTAVGELITNVVASPTPAAPGSRFTVRLLNGVAADSIPADLVRQIVSRGGAVTILGNGPSFGLEKTTVVYANPANKNKAILLSKSIGATGKVRLDREAPDTVDLTIVLGRDILGDIPGAGEAGGTSPETTDSSGGD